MSSTNTDDMEDIIKLLIDMLDNNNISYDIVTLKLRDYHYCISCLQHFNRCKCDENNTDNSSEYDDNYSSSIYDSNHSDSNHSDSNHFDSNHSDYDDLPEP
jgi:hypothetical protein